MSNDETTNLAIGDTATFPGTRSIRSVIIAIDRDPPEPMAWIRRQDELGDYHYHSVPLKELR